MSKIGLDSRSYKKIRIQDLKRLGVIASKDMADFFLNHPEYKVFRGRVICIALCQGAAQHYKDGTTGINDFDVYTFFKKHSNISWYAKRIKSYDFGKPRFGQSQDKPDFIGRRVDCMGREIEMNESEGAISALRRYLKKGKTKTARLLAEKAVVLISPKCGSIVWP